MSKAGDSNKLKVYQNLNKRNSYRLEQKVQQQSKLINTYSTLSGLTDTTIATSPADNEILGYDTASSRWINQTPSELGLVDAINDLSDVTITSVGSNEILQYSGGSWINRTFAEAGLVEAIEDLNNVTITSVANDEVLAYDSGSGEWINQTKSEAGIPEALDDLSDVNLGTPATNEVLSYTGSEWASRNSQERGELFMVQATISYTDLASGGTKQILDVTGTDQYYVHEIQLSGEGTNFDAPGNRNIAIQDSSGTIIYTIIPASQIGALTAHRWGGSGVPYPVTTSDFFAATTAGEDLVAVYEGGSTDYVTGVCTIRLMMRKA